MTEAIYPGNKTKWRLYRAAKVDAASTVSDDLDQATALCEQADDAGQAWLYPCYSAGLRLQACPRRITTTVVSSERQIHSGPCPPPPSDAICCGFARVKF